MKRPKKKKKSSRNSQRREPSRRRSDRHQQRPLRAAAGPRRSGRLLALAVGRVGARVGYVGLDERGPAHLVDHGGRGDVVEVERLAFVRRRGREDGHGAGEAGVAGREAAGGETEAQGQVVDVAVRGGGAVRDGVGEAVILIVLGGRRGVFEAGGVVGDVVGEEAGVGLADLGVLGVVVFLAGGGGAEGEGEGGHEG